MELIDNEAVSEIVCPYCGNAQEDTDYCANKTYEGRETCEQCGKEYEFRANFEIDWTTRKLEE